MTVGPTNENFRSARCARGKNLIFAYFIHHNITKSIKSRKNYHRAEKDADVYFGRTTQNRVIYRTKYRDKLAQGKVYLVDLVDW